jgi:cytochrome c553
MRPPFAALLLAACLLPFAASGQVPIPKVVETKCFLCHGLKGESGSEELPVLAGQGEKYLAKQLRDFLAGRRKGTMQRLARGLSEEEIVAVASYFAAQQPPAHKVTDADLHAAGRFLYQKGSQTPGVPACHLCHGDKARGADLVPRLAGQHAPYLERQLTEFTQRERTNDNEVMREIAAKLSAFDRKALAEYLATLD